MKKRIILLLFTIIMFISIGVALSLVYIIETTEDQYNIIKLHQVEQRRRSLLINLQSVQTDLFTLKTPLEQNLDSIAKNMELLESAAKDCSHCHHSPRLHSRILRVQSLIKDYTELLSFYITIRANEDRVKRLKNEAVQIGNKLQSDVQMMSHVASLHLEDLTLKSAENISNAIKILILTIIITLLIAIFAARRLMNSVTKPVEKLLDATRKISHGKLGTTVSFEEKTEFGELAENFNKMSIGLKNGYDEIRREVDERIETEEKLRKSEERYALAAQGANDGLWDWDLDTNFVYFSPRWKSMLGYEKFEIGKSVEEWFKRLHPDDRIEVEKEIQFHVEGVHPHFQKEFRMIHKDGNYRWMLVRGLAIRDEAGKAYRMAGSQTDITERKIAEEKLLHDAFHDALTELPNRALFSDRLSLAVKQLARHSNKLFAVLFLDLDRFKIINDTLGHMVGDQLLISVSRRLQEGLRPGDTVARFGGDEFAILLDDIENKKNVIGFIERLRKSLSEPYIINDTKIISSVSIGICFCNQSDSRPETLLQNADIAMYHAKDTGRDRFIIFNKEMHQNILTSMHLERDLHSVVENKELVLNYQPLLSIETGDVIGFEALVRWENPSKGLIMPSEFIQLAEDSGQIIEIGNWVLKESCRQIKKWQEDFPRKNPLTISVNVSGKQCIPGLVDQVREVLEETRIEPGTLKLEITETALMDKAEYILPLLNQLKELKIILQIDDFGTGYSSLGYLHNFPIDALKIDRSFISKLDKKNEKHEIVKTITSLAKSLSMYVIAEGVETEEQLLKLKELYCKEVQGFLFSKPMDREETEDWLSRSSDKSMVFSKSDKKS